MRSSRWPAARTDADFAPYLEGAPSRTAELFQRFIDLSRASGPVTFELQTGRVVLCGTRRIFGSAAVTKAGLRGHLVVPRILPQDRRLSRVQPLTRTLYFHRYVARSPSDLDATFAAWLREARLVGDGSTAGR